MITIEMIIKKTTKTLPIREIDLGFDGLKPTSRCMVEMLFGETNPHQRRHTIHLKIVCAKRTPVARIVTIETEEGKLGKASCCWWGGEVSDNDNAQWARK